MATIEEKITIHDVIKDDMEISFALFDEEKEQVEIIIKDTKTETIVNDVLNRKQCQELSYYLKNRSVFFSNVPGPFYTPTISNSIEADFFDNNLLSISIKPIKEKDRFDRSLSIENIATKDCEELAKWLQEKAFKMIEI